ncbi:MAG: glycosyl hydrolase, partial [Actinobacteria bacterium]|nr:glycosyl hydrolase [Actinomycetota bacterium]
MSIPRVLLVILILMVSLLWIGRGDNQSAARQAAAAELARSGRLISYYPSQHPWQRMWMDWSPGTFDRDMAKVATTGAGTVRLIVFPDVFGYPTPDMTMRKRLADAVSIAGAHRLTVQLTLFDYWDDYQDLSGSRQWATALLSDYREDRRIALIEVRNEIDPFEPRAMAWARDQIRLLHVLLPKTPVTISTNGQLGVPGLVALRDALHPVIPDVLNLHYYGDAGLAYSAFRRAMAVAAPTPLL